MMVAAAAMARMSEARARGLEEAMVVGVCVCWRGGVAVGFVWIFGVYSIGEAGGGEGGFLYASLEQGRPRGFCDCGDVVPRGASSGLELLE